MSRLRGHWPEAPNLTYYRGLTARPAVLAKTYGRRVVILPVQRSTARPRTSTFDTLDPAHRRRKVSGVQAIPAVFERVRRTEDAVSTRLRPFSLARYRALSAAFTTESGSELSLDAATP